MRVLVAGVCIAVALGVILLLGFERGSPAEANELDDVGQDASASLAVAGAGLPRGGFTYTSLERTEIERAMEPRSQGEPVSGQELTELSTVQIELPDSVIGTELAIKRLAELRQLSMELKEPVVEHYSSVENEGRRIYLGVGEFAPLGDENMMIIRGSRSGSRYYIEIHRSELTDIFKIDDRVRYIRSRPDVQHHQDLRRKQKD